MTEMAENMVETFTDMQEHGHGHRRKRAVAEPLVLEPETWVSC